MKTNFIKTAVSIALLSTGLAAATAQAGDIKPLHHVCTAGGATNFNGSLGITTTAADLVTFTCPAGYTGSFEVNVRDKTANTTQNVRATHQGAGIIPSPTGGYLFAQDNVGAGGTTATSFNQYPAPGNSGGTGKRTTRNGTGSYQVLINKQSGIAQSLNYELCVACYPLANEGGAHEYTGTVPATYQQNQ